MFIFKLDAPGNLVLESARRPQSVAHMPKLASDDSITLHRGLPQIIWVRSGGRRAVDGLLLRPTKFELPRTSRSKVGV
jgi:hypothetical protein